MQHLFNKLGILNIQFSVNRRRQREGRYWRAVRRQTIEAGRGRKRMRKGEGFFKKWRIGKKLNVGGHGTDLFDMRYAVRFFLWFVVNIFTVKISSNVIKRMNFRVCVFHSTFLLICFPCVANGEVYFQFNSTFYWTARECVKCVKYAWKIIRKYLDISNPPRNISRE